MLNDFNPTFYPVVGATVLILISSTFVLRFGYKPPPKMGWIDAFYFTIERGQRPRLHDGEARGDVPHPALGPNQRRTRAA